MLKAASNERPLTQLGFVSGCFSKLVGFLYKQTVWQTKLVKPLRCLPACRSPPVRRNRGRAARGRGKWAPEDGNSWLPVFLWWSLGFFGSRLFLTFSPRLPVAGRRCTAAALLLVLQGTGGEGGDGGAEEWLGYQGHPPLRRSVPEHQAREHPGRRPGQVPPHGTCLYLSVSTLPGHNFIRIFMSLFHFSSLFHLYLT